MTLDDEQLRSLAEDAVEHMEPAAGEQRMADDRLIAMFGSGSDPQMNVVSRLRLGSSDVDAAVDEVRAWYRRLGRDACTWEVTTASTPGDLHERLLALGMRPYDEPHMLALACTEKPDSELLRKVASSCDEMPSTRALFWSIATRITFDGSSQSNCTCEACGSCRITSAACCAI